MLHNQFNHPCHSGTTQADKINSRKVLRNVNSDLAYALRWSAIVNCSQIYALNTE